jgi:hypothetical protein
MKDAVCLHLKYKFMIKFSLLLLKYIKKKVKLTLISLNLFWMACNKRIMYRNAVKILTTLAAFCWTFHQLILLKIFLIFIALDVNIKTVARKIAIIQAPSTAPIKNKVPHLPWCWFPIIIAVMKFTVIIVDTSKHFPHTLLRLLLGMFTIKAPDGGLRDVTGGEDEMNGKVGGFNANGSEEHLRLFATETVFLN